VRANDRIKKLLQETRWLRAFGMKNKCPITSTVVAELLVESFMKNIGKCYAQLDLESLKPV
jgi:hypothetical protein